MLTEEEKSKIERVFQNLNIKGKVENQDDKIRITIQFRNGTSLFMLSTYDFTTKEELEEFMEPLNLIRQINVISDEKIKIVPKNGLYQEGRWELSFIMEDKNLNINDLRYMNSNLLSSANQEIHEKVNKICFVVSRYK